MSGPSPERSNWTSYLGRVIFLVSVYIQDFRRKKGISSKIDPHLCGLRRCLRIARYTAFKAFEKRILVATDIFGRGIDVERVNIVVNYDSPLDADSYLHRVG